MVHRRRILAGIVWMSIFLLCVVGSARALQVGDKAPEFALPATTADKINLAQYLGHKHVVVFFYIAAFGRA